MTDAAALEGEHKPAPPRFIGERPFRVVPLAYPLEYDGKVYEQITVRRMTAKEVGEFVRAAADGEAARLPMTDAPPEVIEALDADDAQAVSEAIESFLPMALREAPIGDGSTITPPSRPQD